MKIVIVVAGTNEKSNCDVLAQAFMDGISAVSNDNIDSISRIRLKDLKINQMLPFYILLGDLFAHKI